MTVKSASGDQTTVEKQGKAWQVTQPAPVPADEAEISGITSNLASLEVQRVVDEQPTDLKQYGLDPARIEVTFKFAGKDQKLLIGQKTPTGTDVYAKVARQAARVPGRVVSRSRPSTSPASTCATRRS